MKTKFERNGYQVRVEYPKVLWLTGGRNGKHVAGGYEVSVWKETGNRGHDLYLSMGSSYRDVSPPVEIGPERCTLRGAFTEVGVLRRRIEPDEETQIVAIIDDAIARVEQAAEAARLDARIASEIATRLTSAK